MKPNYIVKDVTVSLLHPFPFSPSDHVLILSKIIVWVFLTVLDWLSILRAGLFTVAQGNHAKAGEATCQGGREKTARAGVGWEMPRSLHAWTKQTCRCIYAKSFGSEWRGTQDKQPGWDAGELSHAYGWTCSASKGWGAAVADRETGRLRGKGRGGGSPFRRVHANEHRRCRGVRLSSSLMLGGPSCFQLQRVIWVGGWVYGRYDHKMVSHFLKKHIILLIIQDNIPFLPFFSSPSATTNGMEFCSRFVSGERLLVLGRDRTNFRHLRIFGLTFISEKVRPNLSESTDGCFALCIILCFFYLFSVQYTKGTQCTSPWYSLFCSP